MNHLPVIKEIKDKGRIILKDTENRSMLLILPKFWENELDGDDGIFLLYDTFQIRSVGEQFSEVALDIVEYSNKPVIFYTPASKLLTHGPVKNGLIKFFMMKNPEWKKLLFGLSQPILMKVIASSDSEFTFPFAMPVFSTHALEMYLGAEGDVKILSV